MIDYGLTNAQLDGINKYQKIYNKTFDQFVLSCIGLVVRFFHDNYRERDDIYVRDPDMVTDKVFTIQLPSDLEDGFCEYCDYYGFNYRYKHAVNGMIGSVLEYLEDNWSGEFDDEKDSPTFGISTKNMNDKQKKDLLHKTNGMDDLFNEYFG